MLIKIDRYNYNSIFRQSVEQLNILCWRERFRDGQCFVNHSLYLQLKPESIQQVNSETIPAAIGWEKNERQRLGARQVNLSSSMNPIHLAETAVGLNLKLMKWRLAPEINLETIEQTRCLLLGAGTLGCNVARCLMVEKKHTYTTRLIFLFDEILGLGS